MAEPWDQEQLAQFARIVAITYGLDAEAFVAAVLNGSIPVDSADPMASLEAAAERMAQGGGAPAATATPAPAATATPPAADQGDRGEPARRAGAGGVASGPAGGGVDPTPRTVPPGNPQPGQMYRHDFGGGMTQWLRFDGQQWRPVGERMGEQPAAPAAPGAGPSTAQPIANRPGASPQSELEAVARQAAQQAGVDPDIFLRLIANEDPTGRATSSAGAQGYAQLMPGTAAEMGVTDPFDMKQNVTGGARYLKKMLDMFGGDYRKALTAYNWGPGNVQGAGGNIARAPAETQAYVARILGGGYGPVDTPKLAGQPGWAPPGGMGPMDSPLVALQPGREIDAGPNSPRGDATPETDRLNSRPFAGLTPGSMTQAEGRYYFPWEDPERGGTEQAGYNLLTSMGVNPNSGNPYAGFLEDLIDPLYKTTGVMSALSGQALSPNASGNADLAGMMGGLLRQGRTTAITDLPGALRQLVGVAQSSVKDEDTGPLAVLARRLAEGGGTQAAGLLSSILAPNLSPFLRPYLGRALAGKLQSYRQQAPGNPNLTPLEFLTRGWM